jgi:hypothetical protein
MRRGRKEEGIVLAWSLRRESDGPVQVEGGRPSMERVDRAQR